MHADELTRTEQEEVYQVYDQRQKKLKLGELLTDEQVTLFTLEG